jgi:hypothetical protein
VKIGARESQTAKCSSSCCAYNQTLSEEREERMEIDNNNGDFEESSDIAEPLEIIREEVVEVVEKPNTETSSLASMESQDEEEEDQKKSDNRNRYNGDIYEQVKAQSIQLSSLADMVESVQSQVKQLQETIRLHNKTSSVRKKSTSNKGIKTKKKTKRRDR